MRVENEARRSGLSSTAITWRIEEVKGKVKKVAGKAVGNKDLEKEGKLQNAHGKLQAEFGDVREDIRKST
ncbi:MAG: CsbD family protein [Spirochaetia bacterium]